MSNTIFSYPIDRGIILHTIKTLLLNIVGDIDSLDYIDLSFVPIKIHPLTKYIMAYINKHEEGDEDQKIINYYSKMFEGQKPIIDTHIDIVPFADNMALSLSYNDNLINGDIGRLRYFESTNPLIIYFFDQDFNISSTIISNINPTKLYELILSINSNMNIEIKVRLITNFINILTSNFIITKFTPIVK